MKNSLVIVEANKEKNAFKSPKYSPNDEFVDGIFTGILFSKMAFWESNFGIPLAKKVGNTSKQQIKKFRLRVARPTAWQNFIIKLI